MKDYSFQDYGVSGDACDFQYSFMGFQSQAQAPLPFLAGMIGLQDVIWKITQEEALQLFSGTLRGHGNRGWNPEFGHGLPILGDANMEIKMTIGSKVATVDGKKVLMEQEPFIMRDTGRNSFTS